MEPPHTPVRAGSRRLPLLFAFLGAACAAESADRSGPGVVWDTLPSGTVHVRYASLPAAPRVTVTADLQLGSADGQGEAVFGDIRGIDVDAEGRLLVLDHMASELKAFDAEGRFVELVAGSGEGPREISKANGIRADAEGGVWINDHGRMRLTRLRSDGEVETYPFFVPGFGGLWEGGLTRDGRVWTYWSHSDRPPGPLATGVHHVESRAYYKSFGPATGAYDSVFIGNTTFHSIAMTGSRGAECLDASVTGAWSGRERSRSASVRPEGRCRSPASGVYQDARAPSGFEPPTHTPITGTAVQSRAFPGLAIRASRSLTTAIVARGSCALLR